MKPSSRTSEYLHDKIRELTQIIATKVSIHSASASATSQNGTGVIATRIGMSIGGEETVPDW